MKEILTKELKEQYKREFEDLLEKGIIEEGNVKFLQKLIDKAEDNTEAIFIKALATRYKRTGFHFDVRLEKTQDEMIKYFEKDEKLSFDNGGVTHRLIIGDNYPALLNLLITHRNKIKVIYIDPPYSKDAMGKYAQTNYDNAITRDNLLSMLFTRLSLAKELLREDGVIFCSIDDRNQAYVKGLFDEVFGERNFVCNFIWHSTSNSLSRIRVKTEYVLCYENKTNEAIFKGDFVEGGEDFPILNEINEERILEFPPKTIFFKTFEKNIQPQKFNKMELLDELLINNKTNINKVRIKAKFKWTQEKLNEEIKNKTTFIIKSDEFSMRYIRQGNREIKIDNVLNSTVNISNDENEVDNILNDVTTNIKANNEMISIFGKKVFDYPKPINLIKRLLKISTTPANNGGGGGNSPHSLNYEPEIILDFFAGSGTTAHAVMELNREDGGKRQCILVTNNEENIAHDVTAKRLKRIMSGECYDGSKNFKWCEKNEPYKDSLEVLNIKEIADYDEKIFDKIDERLYGKNFSNIHDKIEWVCENFEKTCVREKEKEEND
ncbi:site-specific DNA-methyltransferase [Campylobacter helveticus]|uniref:site-specific DNA-methyltransferase n=1 Tax=Campylobacter helveticus TaxID=28898 RepID=UPI00214A889D|nr:site-specific DNA-methyltransferase [Campylobacter helveticus]MCR2039641.1 site-specific DNA-methyltransferase [Campylobacter helveticus]